MSSNNKSKGGWKPPAHKGSRYQDQLRGNSSGLTRVQGQLERRAPKENSERTRQRLEGDRIDENFGFVRLTEGLPRVGWLLNYMPITIPDSSGVEKSGVDLYFLDQQGGNFKASILYQPYFLVGLSDPSRAVEAMNYLTRSFEGCQVQAIEKEDLDLPNHLSGMKHFFVKISFNTVGELMEAKAALKTIVDRNVKRMKSPDYLVSSIDPARAGSSVSSDPTTLLVDLREYDVPYLMRVSIDLDIRVGAWYRVVPEHGSAICSEVVWLKDMLELCEPRILAFDIECEKLPLKFPNAASDRIFMISYMVANQGYLLINREVVSEDIEDFEYTPKPSFPGPFKVTNLENEEAVLRYFIEHIKELRPHIVVTYNGDKFDWPYVEVRCSKYKDLGLYSHLGIKSNKGVSAESVMTTDSEYTGRCLVHLDAFCWVQRDSYLPQGNQGLKSVTKHKLGYDPVEVDPEDMLRFAREKPHHMASYSVSDAVATFYLYTTYVHNFIFSLSTIIPLSSEDVLRKGSGTLCEALLMIEAYKGNIVCPNKQIDPLESFHNGHLLDSETYIGGHVECLQAGVYRNDIPEEFHMVPAALQQLIDHIDRDLTFTLEVENGVERSEVVNYEEVKQQIVSRLELLRDAPDRMEAPLIYHLDVGAMYPNIILTNRLQPSAMKKVEDCASCKFNQASNQCKRNMTWSWRGDFSPASASEYAHIKHQLEYEKFPVANGKVTKNTDAKATRDSASMRTFNELPEKEQAALIATRLKAYSQRVYKKSKVTSIEERVSTVCTRENAFYVDTVKAFRDRRYDYKLLTKQWKNRKVAAEKAGNLLEKKQAEDREVLMDSLQLAHKCILNSFYGYVMRKGARWRSMEMAGIVTHTGAQLIRQARELVEQVGRPLELDTDGIWCILPASFPTDFKFKLKNGKGSVGVSYPCAMLNADVHENYTNHQYQVLKGNGAGAEGSHRAPQYLTHSECSIFFELDGPYKAMVLPASPEEGKLLKKKYVVFNFDNTVAELKGFELKRRGELELVKIFQSQVFEQFLAGSSLQECYQAVASIANQWLDVLDSQGRDMDDEELMQLISERKTISKTVDDYDGRKSTSITTAMRLADFLGIEMLKDKGLNCNLIISKFPLDAPVTDRAIPVAIFSCEPAVRKHFLRKWLKDPSVEHGVDDFRDVIDWDYYKERLGKTIQKIVTIPAGMQRVENPVPRVEHPPWLKARLSQQQQRGSMLRLTNADSAMSIAAGSAALNFKKQMTLKEAFKKTSDQQIDERLSTAVDADAKENKTRTPRKRVLFANSNNDEEEHCCAVADIEDVVPSPQTKATNNGNSNNDSTESAITIDEDVEPLFSQLSLSTEEMQRWLAVRKTQWKTLRTARKERSASLFQSSSSLSASSSLLSTHKRSAGVLDFVRSANYTAHASSWQIVEIKEKETAGEFEVWAFTSPQQLQRLSLSVPRTLYVNLLPEREKALPAARQSAQHSLSVSADHAQKRAQLVDLLLSVGAQRVSRDLPRLRPASGDLFEVSLPEKSFSHTQLVRTLSGAASVTEDEEGESEQRQRSSAGYALQVEGVYEASVPSLFRAVLSLGCVARVKRETAESRQLGKFFAADLERLSTQSALYLQPASAIFRRIFVYLASSAGSSANANMSAGSLDAQSAGLSILGVFLLESTNAEEMQWCEKVIAARMQRALRAKERRGEHVVDVESEEEFSLPLPLPAKCFVWLVSQKHSSLDAKPPMKRIYSKFSAYSREVLGETEIERDVLADRQTQTQEMEEEKKKEKEENEHKDVNAHWEVKFVSSLSSSLTDALRSANARLQDALRGRQGPTIVVAQGAIAQSNNSSHKQGQGPQSSSAVSLSATQWRVLLPALHDFPLAVMPAHSADTQPPAVGGAVFLAERMVQRFLLFPRWFQDRLACARYALIPLCNFQAQDAVTTMLDVSFARHVQQSRHCLWASEGRTPDLGLSASQLSGEVVASGEEDMWEMWSEPLTEPRINEPGVYRSVCVELDVFALAISAIMNSGDLDESLSFALTGTSLSASLSANAAAAAAEESKSTAANNSPIFSDASCVRAFNVFKSLVAKYVDELKNRGERLADSLLSGVYRYLCGYGEGLLRDPLLHRLVYSLMVKLFFRLISALRSLGARIVSADFHKIVLCTPHRSLASALEYVDFLLRAISAKETFSYLQISIKTYWSTLVWMETENWAGLAVEEESATESPQEDTDTPTGENDTETPTEIDSEEEDWEDERTLRGGADEDDFFLGGDEGGDYDIAEIKRSTMNPNNKSNHRSERERALDAEPEEIEGDGRLQQRWNLASRLSGLAASYFHEVVAHFVSIYEERMLQAVLSSEGDAHEEALSEEELRLLAVEDMKSWIDGPLTDDLLKIVDEINAEALHSHSRKERSSALDFVKAVTHVMLLDPALRETVSSMRRLLLVQLQVQEFSIDSEFKSLNPSYVLRDVICSYCSLCRDIDLLRDPSVVDEDVQARWRCTHCSNRLNQEEVENRLLEEVDKIQASFFLQDFRCPKTRFVSQRLASSLSPQCDPLLMDREPRKVREQLELLLQVAEIHQYSFLRESINDVLQL